MKVEEKILADLAGSLRDDMKILKFRTIGRTLHFYHLAVWDAEQIAARDDEIRETIDDGFLNLISISEGKSRIIANDKEILDWATKLMADKPVFLRKELIGRDLEGAEDNGGN
jgi:hypothetical protein